MMSNLITELFSKLEIDPWRVEAGFSPDMAEANQKILDAGNNEDAVIEVLGAWLERNQPCLFGRVAARSKLLSFCIITEADLAMDDEYIYNKIQTARTEWLRQGFDGKKSGFILCVMSVKIANSTPNQSLLLLAKEICSKYLEVDEIKTDIIYTDEMFLEIPGDDKMTLKWNAGVNYFCANADKRWWQDHRIPGGLAFSVNSVGHMAKTGGVAKELIQQDEGEKAPEGGFVKTHVDSLGQALDFAMRTIDKASNTISGKATMLLEVTETKPTKGCPIELPKNLVGKDCRDYIGYYHTDYTIPSEYFEPAIERSEGVKVHKLDFTYIYEKDLQNPDHQKMGVGKRIRSGQGKKQFIANPKVSKSFPVKADIRSSSRLLKALGRS